MEASRVNIGATPRCGSSVALGKTFMRIPFIAFITLSLLAGCTSVRLSKITIPDGRYSAAIQAAATLSFSADRASTLKEIAAKPDLSEGEQIYLLEVLRITDGFSADKTHVLLSLLGNQAVTAAAKTKVAEILPKLGLFSAEGKEVADALAR
jgi:hypothetical protein